MMKAVYKFTLEMDTGRMQMIDVPKGSEVLHFAFQREQPRLWMLVNEGQKELEVVHLRLAGTGQMMAKPIKRHLGSAFLDAHGTEVYHLFELEAVNGND
jgi:hypothetical protein